MTACCGGRDFDCTLQINEFVSLIRALRVGTTHWHPDHFSPVCFSEVQTENGNNESAIFNYTIRRWAMLKSAIWFAARRPITAVNVFMALQVFGLYRSLLTVAACWFGLHLIPFKDSRSRVQRPGTNTGTLTRHFQPATTLHLHTNDDAENQTGLKSSRVHCCVKKRLI